ncbi:MAG: PIN domain-containing protein, partial [Clostridioides sp.]|nr:PIN domain-containing protein [Clostridioides sp.]
MIFLDTSFIVAFTNTSDGRHKKAVKIAKEIQNEEKIISNVVIIEVLNILRKFQDGKLNQHVYQIIKDNFIINKEDIDLYDKAIITQVKYKGKLGFADCIIIETMKKLNINKIVSFDRHFDGKE